jgi:hypothetical protein
MRFAAVTSLSIALAMLAGAEENIFVGTPRS